MYIKTMLSININETPFQQLEKKNNRNLDTGQYHMRVYKMAFRSIGIFYTGLLNYKIIQTVV